MNAGTIHRIAPGLTAAQRDDDLARWWGGATLAVRMLVLGRAGFKAHTAATLDWSSFSTDEKFMLDFSRRDLRDELTARCDYR